MRFYHGRAGDYVAEFVLHFKRPLVIKKAMEKQIVTQFFESIREGVGV